MLPRDRSSSAQGWCRLVERRERHDLLRLPVRIRTSKRSEYAHTETAHTTDWPYPTYVWLTLRLSPTAGRATSACDGVPHSFPSALGLCARRAGRLALLFDLLLGALALRLLLFAFLVSPLTTLVPPTEVRIGSRHRVGRLRRWWRGSTRRSITNLILCHATRARQPVPQQRLALVGSAGTPHLDA